MNACTFNRRDKTIEFRSSDIFPPEWVLHLSGAEVSDGEGVAMAQAISVLSGTGKTPVQLAASIADAQAEIARLRGALEKCQTALSIAAAFAEGCPVEDAIQILSGQDAARDALK